MAKRVLLCIHGFMNDTDHDLDSFKEYYESVKTNSEDEVVLSFLYNPLDPKTYKHKLMYKKIEGIVKQYLAEGYEISMLSYSFSAGISAHICKMYPIKKLVLIGPTVYLIKSKLLATYSVTTWKHFKLHVKYGKKAARIMERLKSKGMVRLSINISLSTYRERKHFRGVHCDTFIVKGGDDTFCIDETLSMIAKRVKNATVYTKIYPGRDHFIVFGLERGQEAFIDIINFIYGDAKLINNNNI